MYTNFKPFPMMGMPNKITSDKDLHAKLKCNFFEEPKNKQLESDQKKVVSVTVLKIKLPSKEVVDHHGEEDNDDGGFTTPKAVDQKKIVPLNCPPPPRKPKSVPSTKRKAQRVLLDLSNEIESLFPSNILKDFMCGKIKKVRKESCASL